MRVVDEHERVVRVGQVADLGERRDVAVHREDPVGHDDPSAGTGCRDELRLEVGQVAVLVAEPLRLREPDAVDDRRVVELVADDRVVGAEEHLEHAAVRVEARREEDRVVVAQERRHPALELEVQLLRAADEPHAREAVAPLVETAVRGLDDARVVREPEVVVGAEVQHLAPGDLDLRGLRAVDAALALGEAGGLDLVEFGAKLVANRSVHV